VLPFSGQRGCRKQPRLAAPGGDTAGAFPTRAAGVCGLTAAWGQRGPWHILLPADELSCPVSSPMDTMGPSNDWARLGGDALLAIHRITRGGWQQGWSVLAAGFISRGG